MKKIQKKIKIHNTLIRKALMSVFQFYLHAYKSWRLYNGYSTAGRQPPIFNKKYSYYKIKTVFSRYENQIIIS